MRADTSTTYHPWSTFAAAQQEARRLGDRRVGTDHILIALLRDPEIEEIVGVTPQRAREALDSMDAAALRAIGVDRVVPPAPLKEEPIPARPTARSLMAPRIRLTPGAKACLQEASRPIRRGRRVTPQRVLLALLENHEPDPAATLLGALDVDAIELRVRLGASDAA